MTSLYHLRSAGFVADIIIEVLIEPVFNRSRLDDSNNNNTTAKKKKKQTVFWFPHIIILFRNGKTKIVRPVT